jgi:hypothetical protein
MLRTQYQNKEMILRIKRNLSLYSLEEGTIYQSLIKSMDLIFEMDIFAIYVEECLIVGETQRSAYPLITVQNIVPVKNIVSL